MAQQVLQSRIKQKSDIEANWLLVTNFVPLEGEIIVYEVDSTHDKPRMKIGDGSTLVGDLPFVDNKEKIFGSYSGNPVQVELDIPYIPNVVSTFEPIQAGSGEASPANIRAISGKTGAKLTRCEKNMIPYPYVSGNYSANGIAITVDSQGVVTINGTATGDVYYKLTNPIQFAKGTYTLSGCPSGGGASTYKLYDDKQSGLTDYGSGKTLTFAEDKKMVLYIKVVQGVTCNNLVFKPMLECGSVTHAFEPYQGDDYTASFGQTVYGGKMDWNSGKLTVEYGYMAFDGTENWTEGSSVISDRIRFAYNDIGNIIKKSASMAHVGEIVSSHYSAKSANDTSSGVQGVSVGPGSGVVMFFDDVYSAQTVEDWKNYLVAQHTAGTPIQICYRLAVPKIIQLTPHQIAAFQGTNSLFTDCKNITFGYNSITEAIQETDSKLLTNSEYLLAKYDGTGTQFGINAELYTITVSTMSDSPTVEELKDFVCKVKLEETIESTSTSYTPFIRVNNSSYYSLGGASCTGEKFRFGGAYLNVPRQLTFIIDDAYDSSSIWHALWEVSGSYSYYSYGGSCFNSPVAVSKGGTGATNAETALTNLGAVAKAGDTMTGPLKIQGSSYTGIYMTPTNNDSMVRCAIEASYEGSISLIAQDNFEDLNNRRILQLIDRTVYPSLDNAIMLRDVVDGTWSSYRIYHEGMTTAIPITKGGTGASTKLGALNNLGIVYSETEPENPHEGMIWLKPVL